MSRPNTASTDILQDSAALTSTGFGEVSTVEVTRSSGTAMSLEMWIDISAITAGATGDFFLESRASGGTYQEVLSISINEATLGTPPQARASATSRDSGVAFGDEVRLRYDITGTITAQVRLIRKE